MIFILFGLVVGTPAYFVGKYLGKWDVYNDYTESEKLILIRDADEFNKEKLIQMLKELNVKYPHIVLAQSIIETGSWRSKIFLENNNLFGMKEARKRITTAGGTQHNHAYYNHWRESVYDYAFYQCRYLNSISSETEYYNYLSSYYAESPHYVNSIRELIERENIKNYFKN
jgi:uncharacterized FlgJ-related protein